MRDQLTTAREQAAVASGSVPSSSVGKDAAQVRYINRSVLRHGLYTSEQECR